MKTSQYFIDDTPIQILFLDGEARDGREFFDQGLGNTWFDYDLHILDKLEKAIGFLETSQANRRNLDLLLISGDLWPRGGESFVRQLRSTPALKKLPIYCIISCAKKLNLPAPKCWDTKWRQETRCDGDARATSIPFEPFIASGHPAHINGTLCANNIGSELSSIVDHMTNYWFQASGN